MWYVVACVGLVLAVRYRALVACVVSCVCALIVVGGAALVLAMACMALLHL